MSPKLKLLAIIWAGIIFILISGHLGYEFTSIVSNSMKHEHEESFYQFWKKKGCDTGCVKKLPLANGFQGGDLLVIRRAADCSAGDVVAYQSDRGLIVHRLTDINKEHAFFLADNMQETRAGNIVLEEKIERKFIVGKIIFRVPRFGLIKASLNCWSKGCDYAGCIVKGNCD